MYRYLSFEITDIRIYYYLRSPKYIIILSYEHTHINILPNFRDYLSVSKRIYAHTADQLHVWNVDISVL